jgi:nicotinamide riboside kinase
MFRERGIDFVSVSGSYDERFNKARALVNKLFEKNQNGKQ